MDKKLKQAYVSPETETIKLQGGPCMQDASPLNDLQIQSIFEEAFDD